MRFTVTTWNIISVRLRLAQVRLFLGKVQPDVLCLLETKCPEELFPLAPSKRSAIRSASTARRATTVSRSSPASFSVETAWSSATAADARHIAVRLGAKLGAAAGITIHNSLRAGRRRHAGSEINPEIRHKLAFLEEMRCVPAPDRRQRAGRSWSATSTWRRSSTTSGQRTQLLNVVSHTPVETEALETLRQEAGWIDAVRHLTPEPEKIYTWWSYRARTGRLPTVAAGSTTSGRARQSCPAPSRGVDVLRQTRGWTRPSDHVPVMARFDLVKRAHFHEAEGTVEPCSLHQPFTLRSPHVGSASSIVLLLQGECGMVQVDTSAAVQPEPSVDLGLVPAQGFDGQQAGWICSADAQKVRRHGAPARRSRRHALPGRVARCAGTAEFVLPTVGPGSAA